MTLATNKTNMQITHTQLAGCVILQLPIYHDQRGHFQELYVDARYKDAGIPDTFVQDNFSVSQAGVIRGMHFQRFKAQGKLISVLQGEIYDVMLDLRPDSSTFGQWQAITLDANSGQQLFIPAGFAHGFQALTNNTLVMYKTSQYYDAKDEAAFNALDPKLSINWPAPITARSVKDCTAPNFSDIVSSFL